MELVELAFLRDRAKLELDEDGGMKGGKGIGGEGRGEEGQREGGEEGWGVGEDEWLRRRLSSPFNFC